MGRTGKFGTGSGSGRCSTSGIPSEVRAVGHFEDIQPILDSRAIVEVQQWREANLPNSSVVMQQDSLFNIRTGKKKVTDENMNFNNMMPNWPKIKPVNNKLIDLDGHRRANNDRFFQDASSDQVSEELHTTDSVDASKVEHVVEQLRKRNLHLMQSQGLDLVSSKKFNQELLPTHSDEDSTGLDNYLRAHLPAEKLPSPSKQHGVRKQLFSREPLSQQQCMSQVF